MKQDLVYKILSDLQSQHEGAELELKKLLMNFQRIFGKHIHRSPILLAGI